MNPFYKRLLIWALPALILHILVQEFMLSPEWAHLWNYPAHALIWLLTIAEHIFIIKAPKDEPEQIGYRFLAGSIGKFLLGAIYLLPFLVQRPPYVQPMALWFFLPYFTSLVFIAKETISILAKVDQPK